MAYMIYENPKEDKWYQFKGVKGPSRQSHGISVDPAGGEGEIEDHIRNINKHVCEWRQKGPYIFCTQATAEHGKNIGVHKRLVGTKSGKPILVDI